MAFCLLIRTGMSWSRGQGVRTETVTQSHESGLPQELGVYPKGSAEVMLNYIAVFKGFLDGQGRAPGPGPTFHPSEEHSRLDRSENLRW